MTPKRRGRPPKVAPPDPPKTVRVRCTEKNVWTSYGKLFPGDEAEVPAAEAAALPNVEIIDGQ
jgi:hypothetical protein